MKAEKKTMTKAEAVKLADLLTGAEPRFVDSTLGVVASKIAQAMREQRGRRGEMCHGSKVAMGNLGDGRYAAYRTKF